MDAADSPARGAGRQHLLRGRGYTLAAWSGVMGVAVLAGVAAGDRRWGSSLIVLALLAVCVGVLSFERYLPRPFGLLVVLTALGHAAGWGGGLLYTVRVYDDVLHAVTHLLMALGLCWGAWRWLGGEVVRGHRLAVALLAASVALSLGVLWEFAEWMANSFQPLEDTLPDLALNTGGALLGGALGARFHFGGARARM